MLYEMKNKSDMVVMDALGLEIEQLKVA